MISSEAGRALSLISGIEACKQDGDGFWRSMVTRIVIDLDEAGDTGPVFHISGLLAEMWNKLPDKTGAGQGAEAVGPKEGAS